MARSSQLMQHCRRSTILEMLRTDPDNTLTTPDSQPAKIDE